MRINFSMDVIRFNNCVFSYVFKRFKIDGVSSSMVEQRFVVPYMGVRFPSFTPIPIGPVTIQSSYLRSAWIDTKDRDQKGMK